jgi:DNA-binding CsgD family transcriptional regulator
MPEIRLTSAEEKLFLKYKLTRVQAKVVTLTTRGLTALEVGERFKLSESTVRYHLKMIYRKTKTRGKDELFKLTRRVLKTKR